MGGSDGPAAVQLLPEEGVPRPAGLSSLTEELSLVPGVIVPPMEMQFLGATGPGQDVPETYPGELEPDVASFSTPGS